LSPTAIIEYQAESGVWVRFGDCSSHPSDIKRMLDACLRSQSWIKKARALDGNTEQLIDMAVK
jgi:queuine/archaeosine tRNA-ribosyltransferase